jgi:hypothetical protein
MSTSMSTTSGMTLVFASARHMFGGKVVCVADHAYLVMPAGNHAMAWSTREEHSQHNPRCQARLASSPAEPDLGTENPGRGTRLKGA